MKKVIPETQQLHSEKTVKRRPYQAIAFGHALRLNHAKTRKKSYFRSLCRFNLFLSQVSLFMIDDRYVILHSYELFKLACKTLSTSL